MKKITINLYTLSDFTKWFWDKFCYPRRKDVAQWIDFHNHNCLCSVEDIIIEAAKLDISNENDRKLFLYYFGKINKEFSKHTNETIELIMKK